MKQLLTLDEIAAHLGVHPNTVKSWVARGMPRMQAVPGGRLLFSLPEVEEWMRRERKPRPPQLKLVGGRA
jgi:excisionase family DNA binding protein